MSGNARAALDPGQLYVTNSAPGTVSPDGLTVTALPTAGGGLFGAGTQLSPFATASAKVYFEFRVSDTSTYNLDYAVAIFDSTVAAAQHRIDLKTNSASLGSQPDGTGRMYYEIFWFGVPAQQYIDSTAIYQIALDLATGRVWYGVNNTWKNGGSDGAFNASDPARTHTGWTSGSVTVAAQAKATATLPASITMNFGATPFAYAPPTGFTDTLSSPLIGEITPVQAALYGQPAITTHLTAVKGELYAYALLSAKLSAITADIEQTFYTADIAANVGSKITTAFSGGIFAIEAALPSPDIRAALIGISGNQGTIDAPVRAVRGILEGGYYGIQAELSSLSAALYGAPATLGSMALRAQIRGAFEGVASIVGSTSLTMRAISSSIEATAATTGRLARALPAVRASIGGYTATLGAIDSVLPLFDELGLEGSQAVIGYIDAGMFVATAELFGALEREFSATYVFNLLTTALSTYDDYQFNSYAVVGGSYYGANDNGLYLLEQPGTAVDAILSFGETDFGSEMQKRISDFYAGLRSDGDLVIRIYVDEGAPYEYLLSPQDIATLKQRRSFIGKGLRGKYWRFEIVNQNGSAFEFDSMNIAVTPTERRV